MSPDLGRDLGKKDGRKRQAFDRGYVMVFAVFLAVAIETVAAGNMANLMSFHRSADRILSQMRMTLMADAATDRTLLLFRDYIKTTNRFPNTTSVGAVNSHDVVLGNDSATVTNGKTFSQFLSDWMEAPGTGLKSRYNVLHRVSMAPADVKIFELRRLGPDQREYEIRVTIHDTNNEARTTASQAALITNGHLFDFSIFYNEDLEITSGPDFKVQGPIFTNKNVYLMNDMGHTLTLTRASDFNHPDNSQKYVLNAAGNIYFYFKRAVGHNYLLDNPVYVAGVPAFYNNPERVELYPRYHPGGIPAPFLYYFRNGARISDNRWNGTTGPDSNHIRVEDEDGDMQNLVPLHPALNQHEPWFTTAGNVTHYMDYTNDYNSPAGSQISISTAFNPAGGISLADAPLRNPRWNGLGTAVKDRVPTQTIPIGDPDNPAGPHLLIEPLTGTFDRPLFAPGSPGTRAAGWDTPETAALKLQSQADVNIYIRNSDGTVSADFGDLLDKNILDFRVAYTDPNLHSPGFSFHDYRMNEATLHTPAGITVTLVLDIQRLLADRPNTKMVYVHTYPFDQPNNGVVYPFVMLINGGKLPEEGLTVATNGRLWIQGDYNTYRYAGKVPPAAIFSDSFGVLSNQWSHSYRHLTPLAGRPVTSDVSVNAAVAAGYLPSQAVPRFSCAPDMSNCRTLTINAAGTLNGNVTSFLCPNRTYDQGIGIRDPECEYYQEIVNGAPFYYVNPRSTLYQTAMGIEGSTLPTCNPSADERSAQNCDRIRQSIVMGNGVPVSPFYGVLYESMYRSYLEGTAGTGEYRCPDGGVVHYSDSDPLHCTEVPPTTEKTSITYINCQHWCDNGNPEWVVTSLGAPPLFAFGGGSYERLSTPYQSGGVENLINLQEDWVRCDDGQGGVRPCILHFSGTLTAPWTATELHYPDQSGIDRLAYYGITCYSAPERDFDFNEQLKLEPPPGTPSVFNIKRGAWQRVN